MSEETERTLQNKDEVHEQRGENPSCAWPLRAWRAVSAGPAPAKQSHASGCTRKTRIIDVVYNASNNELVRTKTLVKNCIVLVDSTPYRQWYEAHYALPLGRKKGAKLTPEEEEILNKKRSKKIQKKYDERKKNAKIASILEEQFQQGKLLACIASRPGQCGRADGYVLEGKELEFYLRKIKARKGK
uniref:Small ribosomal subunit protein eS8 n=1 Tax=Falco tinnunculus TaxID=100819 RepID=A0A8C4V6A3_FALTI